MLLAMYSTNGVMVNTAILKCSALTHSPIIFALIPSHFASRILISER
ncbi:MAG: hypothetical protein CM1200mP4_1490 [Rhodospirillaceae bacterium]|nr:MAG: hypothetical protein CM1200mP4_1490 [Rhodospirillaceae bacterium]